MKKNWFQILSLALNVMLLIALLVTRTEFVDTQTILKSNLDGIAYRLSDMDDRITNLSAKQREQTEDLSDFSFEPTGLDPESHTLQVDMSITLQYDLGIRKQYGTEVIDPVFQVLKNGETVQTLPVKISESTVSSDPDVVYYTPASENGGIAVSCQPEDTVELHLLCRDSFGLSYDFTVCTYEIDQDGTMVEEVWPDTDYNVRVFWEK